MIDTSIDTGALQTWSAPQCPFVIQYMRRAVDDIRLAVVDAFFSLPRGGAEIGGILLGKFEPGKLLILDYVPLECEHAFGPSFTLSPKDQARLSDLLASAKKGPADLQPVGWYHSHTRSEICLSETDLELYHRYFPEMSHVALVLRPSTFQATRAGFFFRDADGSVSAKASYQEFAIEPLPIQPAPVPNVPYTAATAAQPGAVPPALASSGAKPPAAAEHTEPAPPVPETQLAALALAASAPAPLAQAVPDWPQARELGATAPSEAAAPPPADAAQSHAPEQAAPQETTPLPVLVPEDRVGTEIKPEDAAELRPSTPPVPMKPIPALLVPRRNRMQTGLALTAMALAGLALLVFFHRRAGVPQPHPPAVAAHTAPVPRPVAEPAPVVARPPAAIAATPSRPPVAQPPAAPQTDAARTHEAALAVQNAGLVQLNSDLRRQNADLTKATSELRKQNTELGSAQSDLRRQRDDFAKENSRLKTDLNTQTARAKQLQQQLDEARKQQQAKRMRVQVFDPLE